MSILSSTQKSRTLLLYSISLALLLFFLKWLEIRFMIFDNAFEVYAGSIAVLFTGLGIWLALKLAKPKTIVFEKEIFISRSGEFFVNEEQLNKLGISKRELEVMGLIALGLSNKEIADRLFVSLNTIKTHSSNLFEKMEVKSRTQAIAKAKQFGLIA